MESFRIFKALGDATRFRIVSALLQREYCVSELARSLGLSASAVSQHLSVLKEAGLLLGEKRGYFMHYQINRDALRALATAIADLVERAQEPCAQDHAADSACCCQHSGATCSEELQQMCHGAGDLRQKKK